MNNTVWFVSMPLKHWFFVAVVEWIGNLLTRKIDVERGGKVWKNDKTPRDEFLIKWYESRNRRRLQDPFVYGVHARDNRLA